MGHQEPKGHQETERAGIGTMGTGSGGGRGRLARLIATRGGKAAPEKPFVIEHREALIYLLCQAAELEHAIMCQYLFAAFSLKQDTSEGLSDGELAVVSRWRTQVSHVATQEMLHLALVENLLSAIGGAPHLSRPNLPAPAGHYPAGVRLVLLPFGEQALRHFMFLERPEGMDLEDADGLAAMDAAVPVTSERDIVPHGQDFATVGHLYRSIEAGFSHLTAKYGEDWLFAGPPRAQATQQHFGWPELVPVTDLASACRAIDEILEQGEGPRGHWRNAHFGQFVAILDEYHQMRKANPGFEPARPVIAANVRPHERLEGVPLISDPAAAQVCDLFNVGYEVLLLILQRFFAHTTESGAQLKALADATIALMLRVIKPLGGLLTALPAGPEHPGRTAAPSFELFYESDYLLPHQRATWAMMAERLDVAAGLSDALCAGDTALAAQLSPVTGAFRDIAGALAAHLPAGTPQAAIGSPWSSPGQARTALTRISQLLNEASVAATPPQAPQLTELAAAAAAAAAALGTERASGAVWDTARAVTGLRTSLGRAGQCPPALAEAAAAVQDLALRLAPAGERQARLAQLWELQSGLTPSVQPVPGGPYLAANVPTVIDHLGNAARPAPQLALCRCGESAVKPACDGACARNGFSDAKDPGRVPDRRDTYHGQQATVFDNRGICQHSGFCTDRLPSAFRTDREPFVAPSGGRLDEIIRAVRDCPSGALSYALGGQEARRHVDWDHTRPAAIEITADGPYRVTGGLPLTDPGGEPVARAEGSSAEHYALCRCGHSRNKPFCSGMHWYVQFRDPVRGASPTLFEHAGGLGPLMRAARLLHEKHVPADPLLAPVYAQMPPDQPQRLAAWLAAALGGGNAAKGGTPASRSRRAGNGDARGAIVMENPALPPGGQPLTAEQAARWVALAGLAADDAKLPADPGFRAAWSSCAEWVARTASQPGAAAAAPVPQWDWGPAGPPPAADETAGQEAATVTLPGPGEPVSFETHIKPLFRERDRQSMSFAFDLWAATDVRAHAAGILERLDNGSMPCDGAWPAERTEVFRRWTQTGMSP
jgi:CDGSH-type Zn-finger protein